MKKLIMSLCLLLIASPLMGKELKYSLKEIPLEFRGKWCWEKTSGDRGVTWGSGDYRKVLFLYPNSALTDGKDITYFKSIVLITNKNPGNSNDTWLPVSPLLIITLKNRDDRSPCLWEISYPVPDNKKRIVIRCYKIKEGSESPEIFSITYMVR